MFKLLNVSDDPSSGHITVRLERWSRMRESNPRLMLGKHGYYHYTNPADRSILTVDVSAGCVWRIHTAL